MKVTLREKRRQRVSRLSRGMIFTRARSTIPGDKWGNTRSIDLRHQYGISVAESQTFLLAKRPSAAMSEEKRLPSAGYRIPENFACGIWNTRLGNPEYSRRKPESN